MHKSIYKTRITVDSIEIDSKALAYKGYSDIMDVYRNYGGFPQSTLKTILSSES